MKKLLKDVRLKKNIRKNKIYMISLLYLMKDKIKKQIFKTHQNIFKNNNIFKKHNNKHYQNL